MEEKAPAVFDATRPVAVTLRTPGRVGLRRQRRPGVSGGKSCAQEPALVYAFYGNMHAQATVSFRYSPPEGLSVHPASGSSTTQQFSFSVTDPNGGHAVSRIEMLFNNSLNGQNACYFVFHPGGSPPFNDAFQLVHNSGTGWVIPHVPIGSSNIAENSQCRLSAASGTIQVSGNAITVSLTVTFKPGFSGFRQIYMKAENNTGGYTYWTHVGGWDLTANPPAQPPAIFLDTPATGATVSGAVTLSGWAIDNVNQIENPITRVEIWVDGVYRDNATYGVSRPDVCTVYPGRHGCPNVGFTYSLNTHTLANGSRTLSVVAFDYDNPAKSSEVVRTINVNNSGSPPVSVTPTSVYLATGWQYNQPGPETQQFTARLYGQISSAVNWSLECLRYLGYQNVALGTITAGGFYQAPFAPITAGHRVRVRANSQADPAQYADATVMVMGFLTPQQQDISVSSYTTAQFYSFMGNVTWEISPAGMGTISPTGLYTAPLSGFAPGQVVKVNAKTVADPTIRQQGCVRLFP